MAELIESGEITTRRDSEGTSQLHLKKESSWSGNMLITVRSDVSKSLETQGKVLVNTKKWVNGYLQSDKRYSIDLNKVHNPGWKI